jgi:Flp pilus assembly protein TadD
MSSRAITLDEATRLFESGDYDQAQALCRTLLHAAPEDTRVIQLMGALHLKLHEFAAASRCFRQALSSRPDAPELHNNLGVALSALKEFDSAAASLATAIQLRPTMNDAWANLIGVLHRQGRQSELDSAIESWATLCPQSIRAHQQRAAHRYEAGRVEAAARDYGRLARLRPHRPHPRLQQGLMLHELGRDSDALHAFSDASRRAYRSGRAHLATTASKLQHDIEQFVWLHKVESSAEDWTAAETAYREVLSELLGAQKDDKVAQALTASQLAAVEKWYRRPLHVVPCRALDQGALSSTWDSAEVNLDYQSSSPGITWIDDFLQAPALEQLRRFCLQSTIWAEYKYTRGYLGSSIATGFINGLLLQIASELRSRLPELLGAHPLRQVWAYKYDAQIQGITPHADSAAVNVNFWITPDTANRNPETGGIVVWPECAPLDWDFSDYNRTPEKLMDWIAQRGLDPIEVPHRSNRAVLFDSNLVHRTGDLDFQPGYENRRINITMLFGQRGSTP